MFRSFALATALAALLATAFASGAAASPTANAARTCGSLGSYPGQGYFTRLVVFHVSCATGKRVMRAHYRCRTRHGRSGRCPSVLGYHCTEIRRSNPVEYQARVTCKRGSRKVIYNYQQNLD